MSNRLTGMKAVLNISYFKFLAIEASQLPAIGDRRPAACRCRFKLKLNAFLTRISPESKSRSLGAEGLWRLAAEF